MTTTQRFRSRLGRSLAPFTVLVGGTLLRPYLQRRMATLPGGHANVAFVTAAELAVQLGESRLVADGRLPVSGWCADVGATPTAAPAREVHVAARACLTWAAAGVPFLFTFAR